jgi:N-acetylmuramic acid 6-phosphate (MurNAc-6-P) etherase
VGVPLPPVSTRLDPALRVGVKLALNALSTCIMVRLGRVLGNRMIYVVPSNLKLIDRATRYIRDLAGVSYEAACYALFEAVEHVEPRMRAGRAYPPPVGIAVMRLRHGIDLAEAERRLAAETG